MNPSCVPALSVTNSVLQLRVARVCLDSPGFACVCLDLPGLTCTEQCPLCVQLRDFVCRFRLFSERKAGNGRSPYANCYQSALKRGHRPRGRSNSCHIDAALQNRRRHSDWRPLSNDGWRRQNDVDQILESCDQAHASATSSSTRFWTADVLERRGDAAKHVNYHCRQAVGLNRARESIVCRRAHLALATRCRSMYS
jgi:hypothetical protein